MGCPSSCLSPRIPVTPACNLSKQTLPFRLPGKATFEASSCSYANLCRQSATQALSHCPSHFNQGFDLWQVRRITEQQLMYAQVEDWHYVRAWRSSLLPRRARRRLAGRLVGHVLRDRRLPRRRAAQASGRIGRVCARRDLIPCLRRVHMQCM